MRIRAGHPIGATVVDVDLEDLDGPHDTDLLRDALAEHGVLVVPDQHRLDDAGFVAFLGRLGTLQFTDGETPVDGHEDLNVVTNAGRERAPVSNWHVDTAYVSSPPSYTALRAVDVPTRGGETLFSNQYRAWETLDPEMCDRVAERLMTHVVTGVEPPAGSQTEADHPLVRPHPRCGRRALFLDAMTRCRAVSDLDEKEARTLVTGLIDWSTRPDNVTRHRWRPHDVVIWDNAVVMHRGDHSDVVGERTFHRGMVGSDGYGS